MQKTFLELGKLDNILQVPRHVCVEVGLSNC
jgi:hypothetical protein